MPNDKREINRPPGVSLAFILFALLPLPAHAQKHPDLSGTWTLASQSCQPAKLHSRTGFSQMTINHADPMLRVAIKSSSKGKMQELSLAYRTDGEELHYTGLDGDDFRSTPHWQGNELVFTILELEDGKQIHTQETWELRKNGAELLRTKKEDGEKEHSTCTAVFTYATPTAENVSPVHITLKTDRIEVDIQGQPFTNLYMGAEAHKPFLYPLRTASGKKVTRGYPVEPLPNDPTDHPHQKGLWIGSERVSDSASNRMDFWENDPSYNRPNMGTIAFKDVLDNHSDAGSGSFTMLADWISRQGESVVTEKRKMTFYGSPADCRMFDVDLLLKAKRELTFEDHHDSVIGIRLGPAFDEKNGGRPVNAQGFEGEAQTRGKRSEWVDWQTNLDGEDVGVSLMDHPDNFSSPTRWHIRSMGLLVASPFAQHDYSPAAPDASKTLHPSEELHLRYRVLIHPKNTDVAAIYKEFAAQ